MQITGCESRGFVSNRSPKISIQYRAIFNWFALLEKDQYELYIFKVIDNQSHLQWFSKDKITGNSDTVNAVSRIATITSWEKTFLNIQTNTI